MDEYIYKQSVIDYLNGYLHSIGECKTDNLLFDRGQRRALINSIQDIMAIKAVDVELVKGWISVKERLPENDGLYIVCKTVEEHQVCFEARFKGNKWLSVVKNAKLDCVTHWMPLPEPPPLKEV